MGKGSVIFPIGNDGGGGELFFERCSRKGGGLDAFSPFFFPPMMLGEVSFCSQLPWTSFTAPSFQAKIRGL